MALVGVAALAFIVNVVAVGRVLLLPLSGAIYVVCTRGMKFERATERADRPPASKRPAAFRVLDHDKEACAAAGWDYSRWRWLLGILLALVVPLVAVARLIDLAR